MTIMIPASLPQDVSRGERLVYESLAHDDGAEEWICLHSLDIARHVRQISGEADFLILVPGAGILCLEIKGYETIRCDQGVWHYGEGAGQLTEIRGPLQQASTAMYSLKRIVNDANTSLSAILWYSAVAFPFAPFNITSAEWHDWQVVDNHLFHSQKLSQIIMRILKKAAAHTERTPSASWFSRRQSLPSPVQCKLISQIVRPEFEVYQSPSSRREAVENEVLRYTEEQYTALDGLAANEQVMFHGPAGTGKTLLAIEAARRAVHSGRRVLFLCYNRYLSIWLARELNPLSTHVTVSTIHKHMLSVSGRSQPPPNRPDDYWDVTLPEDATYRLLGEIDQGNERNIYDEVIIDEAQDLLADAFLDFVDASLRGGLRSGRWRIFGDFTYQAINDPSSSLDALHDRSRENITQFELLVNCRNPKRVAHYAALLGHLSPGYKEVLRPDNSVDPEMLFYSNRSQKLKQLEVALNNLYRHGFSGNDIAIISPGARGSAAKQMQTQPWKDRIIEFQGAPRDGHIVSTTIRKYKGLEAPVVVLTDIVDIGSERELFYVACTRTVEKLVVIAHEKVRAQIEQELLGGN